MTHPTDSPPRHSGRDARPVVARVGAAAPDFSLQCIDLATGVGDVILSNYAGRWLMLAFYPRDFSTVCPTELTSFSARIEDFARRDCAVLGVSVDSIEAHREWLETPPEEGGLGPLQFPLASDPDGVTARSYGVWLPEREVAARGLFVIDPDGTLQYAVVHNLSVGRSVDEVVRVLDALRTGGLCPANWTRADGTLDAEAALSKGRVLGHYRIRRRLGGGRFGTVLAARDMRLHRMVALKVLSGNAGQARRALLEEARAAAALNHPNVCTIYAVEETDGLPVIAMEYVDGEPLAELIAHGLSEQQARVLGRRTALGMAAAHAQDVVHGDLKPANILVADGLVPKILDFGLARSLRQLLRQSDAAAGAAPHADEARLGNVDETILFLAEHPSDHTAPPAGVAETAEWPTTSQGGVISGTPAYMSPEQARGELATAASDVFALGLILYEMLTGERAMRESSAVKQIYALQQSDAAADLASRVSPSLQPLLNSMLARDVKQRPAMEEIAAALQ